MVQDKGIFLHKPYDILSKASTPTILEPSLIQKEIDNLKKVLRILQAPKKMIPFLSPDYYRVILQGEEMNSQYWKKIIDKFIKQKHNSDTSRWEFPIKIYTRRPSYKPFFIILILWRTLVIKPTKKLVATYIVGDLTFPE